MVGKDVTQRQTYGEWLKAQRVARGYSQKRVSEGTGIGTTYLSKIESGTVDLPNPELRERVHDFFGTTEDDLVSAGVIAIPGRDRRTGALPIVSGDGGQVSAMISEIAKVVDRLPLEQQRKFLTVIRQMAEMMRDGSV
jgi:transcriptional regulator with XRE-family HTH domain